MAEGARGLKKPGLAWTWSHAPGCSCSSQGAREPRGARRGQTGPKGAQKIFARAVQLQGRLL